MRAEGTKRYPPYWFISCS